MKSAGDIPLADIEEADDESVAESAAEESPDAEDAGGQNDEPTEASGEDEPEGPNKDDKGDKGKKSKTRSWKRVAKATIRWAAVAGFVAVLTGASYEGWLLYQQHQKDLAAAQALEAARKYAVTLTSTDPNAIDQNFTDVLGGATGDFKDTYTKTSSRLRKMLIDNKVATQGTVVDSAVKSASTNKVEVLLFVRQSITNSESPNPHTDLTAVTMTMEKINGRWLASKVVLPAEGERQ